MSSLNQENKLKVFMLPFAEDNPYQTKLCDSLKPFNTEVMGTNKIFFIWDLLKYKPDIVHFHWLQVYFIGKTKLRGVVRLILFLFQLTLILCSRTRIVWTAHNLINHENKQAKVDSFITRLICRISTKIITHSNSAKTKIAEFNPNIDPSKISVIYHGNFIDDYQSEVSRDDARVALSLGKNDFVILFLGQIREYKGVTDLISAFSSLPYNKNVKLLIAGKAHTKNLENTIRDQIGNNSNIIFLPKFIPDLEIATYFAAADIVALPYRSILTSGALVMAMGFGKPVIIPNIESLVETTHPDASVVYPIGDITKLAKAISKSTIEKDKYQQFGVLNQEKAMNYSWEEVGKSTFSVYKSALYD